MQLTDREAILLAQVLAIYEDGHLSAGTSDMQRAVSDLRKKVEDFLAGDGGEDFVLTIPTFESDFNVNPTVSAGEEDLFPSLAAFSSCGALAFDDEDLGEDDEKADEVDHGGEEAPTEEDCAECEVCGEGEVPQAEDGDGAPALAEEADEPLSDTGRFALQLLNLPSVKTNFGTGRFLMDGDHVNFDVSPTGPLVEDVSHFKRFAKAFHLCDGEGEWHVLHVNKWPKLWIKRIPVKQLIGIVS